jgi:hypothetical protein
MTHLDSRGRPAGCLSQYAIDRLVAGELDAASTRQAVSHIKDCSRCDALLEQTKAQKEEFSKSAPPLVQRPRPDRAERPARRLLPWIIGGAPALAAALALLLLYFPTGSEEITSKGAAYLTFIVEHQGRQRRGRPRETVYPGDKIQLFYSSNSAIHLGVFNRDERGDVTALFPQTGRTTRLGGGEQVALPFSTELDDVLGTETFYGIFCSGPHRISSLIRRLGVREHEPRAPAGCTIDKVVLNKRALPDVR